MPSFDGKRYTLTPRVLELGFAWLSAQPLFGVGEPIAKQLAERLNETVSIGTLDIPDVVYVVRALSSRALHLRLGPGTRIPAHTSSMGIILLGTLEPSQLAAFFKQWPRRRYTDRTPVEESEVRALIQAAGRDGFCYLRGVMEDSIAGLSRAGARSREGAGDRRAQRQHQPAAHVAGGGARQAAARAARRRRVDRSGVALREGSIMQALSTAVRDHRHGRLREVMRAHRLDALLFTGADFFSFASNHDMTDLAVGAALSPRRCRLPGPSVAILAEQGRHLFEMERTRGTLWVDRPDLLCRDAASAVRRAAGDRVARAGGRDADGARPRPIADRLRCRDGAAGRCAVTVARDRTGEPSTRHCGRRGGSSMPRKSR